MAIRGVGTNRNKRQLPQAAGEPILGANSASPFLACYSNRAAPMLRSVLVGDPIRTRTIRQSNHFPF
jgi:hypothetical protein